MADSFFGFDTSVSNLNDDEGGGGPSEDEYDALNDETFGQDSDVFDWEMEHELAASQLESSRRSNVSNTALETSQSRQLEASLSQLVLDETDAPQSRTLGSAVWRHELPFGAPTPVPSTALKNVCTVEEIERQLRQKQAQQQPQGFTHNFFQQRYPVILQRPPGLQAPVGLPFAPQNMGINQSMNQINQQSMNQPLNNVMTRTSQSNMLGQSVSQMGQNVNHMGQNVNPMGQNVNHLGQNVTQMGQNVNPMGQNVNPMGQNMTQMGQNVNQMVQNANQIGQNVNQFMQNANQMAFQNNQMKIQNQIQNHMLGQNMNHMTSINQMNQNATQMAPNVNQMGQNITQMGQMTQNLNHIGPNVNQLPSNLNQMGPNVNQMGQNLNQMGPNHNAITPQMNQNVNQMGQNMNQMGQNMNQMGQNMNQMMPNGTFPPMNQFPPMMGQPRMMGPPPGMNMPRQNFSPNMVTNSFRGPTIQQKTDQMNQQKMLLPQPLLQQPLNNQPAANTTQNHQSPQKSNQKTRIDPKTQKSRVYNNSNLNGKSLTSQNMVQIIQNTHPMLQFNNSFHNANHHPMLNNRNNLLNQFENNQMFNQRQNGTYNDHRHSLNGDDLSSCSDDEYAGLMTPREKQWLINIQMLQLNSGTPYIHDFYYTVFLERQANKEKEGIKEAHKANQQNHPFYSGVNKSESHARERHNSHRHNSTSEDGAAPRTYVPAQFENSLGKLQCGSVTAPRKIIDVDLMSGEPASGRVSRAASVASTTNATEIPRELKRTKQLLLDIEALYLILLRLEELNDPLAISNALILKEREEKQKLLEAQQKELENEQEEDSNVFLRNIESVHRRPKQDSPKSETVDKRQVVSLTVNSKPAPVKNLLDEDKDDLINRIYAGLLHSDRLQMMLGVRKGRCLVARFLRRSPATHHMSRAVWSRVLRALPSVSKRDDGGLAQLATSYKKYIQSTSGWSPILESCSMLSEALDPARTPYALTTPLTLSCVCALLEKATTLVTTPDATSNERQWFKFLKTLARALKNTSLTVAKPVQPLAEQKVMQHVKFLESRSTVEILQRGKSAEFADLSKNDVSEQLIKHLC